MVTYHTHPCISHLGICGISASPVQTTRMGTRDLPNLSVGTGLLTLKHPQE